VFSVIGVMTTVSAIRGSIEAGLTVLGSNMFQLGKYPVGIQIDGNDRDKYHKRRNITLAEAERYQQLMDGWADVVSLKAGTQGAQAMYGGRKTTPSVNYMGANEYFLQSDQYSIDIGRNFTGADIDLGQPVALIGQTVAGKLFPSESPLGEKIKIQGHAYLVIGTFASRGSSFGQDQDDIVVVPISRFLSDNGAGLFSLNIATQSLSPAVYNATVDRAITVMRIVRGLRPEDQNDFELFSNDSLIAAFAKVADAVRAGALVISAIALLAAGVGIMNIMLVSVTERTKEIGVRKSVGARKTGILAQFLIESVALSLSGGVAGVVLGAVAGNALAVFMHADIVFPWAWAAIGLLVCSGIGVGFGLYPAAKAAMLDPIEALRYE
jgi:putative ABC transport system permease protein